MGAGAHSELWSGTGISQLLEEHVGHGRIVMLPGVNQASAELQECDANARSTGAAFMKFGRAPTT